MFPPNWEYILDSAPMTLCVSQQTTLSRRWHTWLDEEVMQEPSHNNYAYVPLILRAALTTLRRLVPSV